MEHTTIRDLKADDAAVIDGEFSAQGWKGRGKTCENYLRERDSGTRDVIGIFQKDLFCGYVTLIWKPDYPHFNKNGIPEISDLNVLQKHRGKGFGLQLMLEAENRIFKRGSVAGLGVGLLPDYGAAQKLYAKLGYIPDGLGIAYRCQTCTHGDTVVVDDDLCLWMVKASPLGEDEQ